MESKIIIHTKPQPLIEIFVNNILFLLKFLIIILGIALISSCSSSKEFSKYDNVEGKFIESGEASWYGPKFHGRLTANGETYNQFELTAAHRTLPFNSIVKVLNKRNNRTVIVRINDRGPYAKNRIIDLSRKAAEEINMIETGHEIVDIFLLSDSKLPINLKIPHYTVQVGSYKRKTDANIFSRKIQNSRVVDSLVNGEKYYRVYVGKFNNITKAKSLRDRLKNKGYDCFVKQIEN